MFVAFGLLAAIAFFIIWRLSTRLPTEKKIFRALKDEPQSQTSLVRDHSLSPLKTREILMSWNDKQWITRCEPPADAFDPENNQVWYRLTFEGSCVLKRYQMKHPA